MEFTTVETAWGIFGFVACDQRLVATFLPQPRKVIRESIANQFPDALEAPRLLPRFQREVRAYFQGEATRFSVQVDLSSHPPFRAAVLEACRRVPYGRCAS